MLAGRVSRGVRNGPQSSHRRHEDNRSPSLGDHGRDEALSQRDARKDVDLEHRPQALQRLFRNRPSLHEAGVAEEDINVMTEGMLSIGCIRHIKLLYLELQALRTRFLL